MRPVSPEFARIVRGSHQMCARARVVEPGQTGVDPDGVEIPILAGNVEMDADADVRATLELETDGTGWSTNPDGLLVPYGAEVFVERGIVHGNGDREWVSQGYFRIDTVEQDTAPNGPVRITASDRMAVVIDARLLSPVQFGQGTSVRDVVAYLLSGAFSITPPVTFDFDADNTTLGATQVAERDRHEFLLDLVTSLGKVAYFDHEGRLRIEDPPDPTQPVWAVSAGEGGVLVSMSRSVSRDGVYNAVVAEGEVPGEDVPPARAVAYDMAPESPTFWDGPFGRVPRFYSSSMITTQQQARDAARSMLTKKLGLPYNVDFASVPNPALEPLDPVVVDSGTVGGTETHVLQTISLSLVATDAMEATTREQTEIHVEVD